MKPLKEKVLIKDATIPKVQFYKEWFYKPNYMGSFVIEDL